jgi:hypothetical protein
VTSDALLSERDQRILELNQQGHSAAQISKVLNSEGIELSKRSVLRHLTELRQDPDNNVKVNFKYKSQKPKSEFRWHKIIQVLRKEIAEYTRTRRTKPSSRTMFYQLQDLGLVKPHEDITYSRVTVLARLEWRDSNGELMYPKLDIDCFSDDSRLTSGEYDDDEPEEVIEPGEIPDPDEYIQNVISESKEAPDNYEGVGEKGVDGKIGGRWYNQPNYVEVWEEKNDLMRDFEIIFKGKAIKLRANKGYSSLVFLYECTEELKKVIETKKIKPENIYIEYFGDWDPSGLDIDNYIKKRLKQLGISGIHFERVSVTHEQIRKYKLPLMSLKRPEGKKADNPNLKEFRRLYGNEATHLNAFLTKKHIKDFKKLAHWSVDQHWDKSIYDEMVEEYDVEASEPDSYSQDELDEIRREMRRKITEAFAPGWYDDNENGEDEN